MLKPYQNKYDYFLPMRIVPVLEGNENLKVCDQCKGKGKLLMNTLSGQSDWQGRRVKCPDCDGIGAVEATWTEKIVF